MTRSQRRARNAARRAKRSPFALARPAVVTFGVNVERIATHGRVVILREPDTIRLDSNPNSALR